ncbi:MFS transporter [uncultured Jatrophihabitans sp.]|uniref:MFS transporter n=1 Tax=uncultured Jatrophihabitans sp. TaxID=1610747 RepID=UPI0035CA133C
MRSTSRQLCALVFGSSLGAVGWGAVLPFLYADIAQARGLGAGAAAVTFIAFALGALLAAPAAGRLADRARPVVVATVARTGMIVAVVGLMFAGHATTVWLAALGYGAALAVVQPATSVMVLELSPAHRRRDAFAWQSIGQNLGLAVGGFAGGHLVNLTTPTGARPAYLFAALASVASLVLVGVVGRRAERPALAAVTSDELGYRQLLGAPAVRWLLAVTGLLTLACYAQYDSGLPSYALTVLSAPPTTLGTAVAVNAVLVAALTAPVIRATRRTSPALLLAACASIWVVVWLVLAAPMLGLGGASAFVIGGYALFSLGETVLAPVLSPLAAALAPDGAVGRTLAAMNAAQTAATALGPALSGVLLALGVPFAFIGLQLLCCVAAIIGARRLHVETAVLSRPRGAGWAHDELAGRLERRAA